MIRWAISSGREKLAHYPLSKHGSALLRIEEVNVLGGTILKYGQG